MHWCWYVLNTHGAALSSSLNSMAHLESIRALIRAVSTHEREIMKMSDENLFSLSFLTSQMVERTSEELSKDSEEEDSQAMVVVPEEVADTHSEDVTAVASTATATTVSTAAVVVEPPSSSSPVVVSCKKSSKKASKKLTIQTGAAEREQLLQSANSAVDVTEAPAEDAAVTMVSQEEVASTEAAEDPSVFEEISTFATPSRKKDKKSAKSTSKSLLKATGGLGFDVSATAERRVSFSHPLSMVKIISPLSTGGQNSTPGNSGKKSSKKRLWAEEDA